MFKHVLSLRLFRSPSYSLYKLRECITSYLRFLIGSICSFSCFVVVCSFFWFLTVRAIYGLLIQIFSHDEEERFGHSSGMGKPADESRKSILNKWMGILAHVNLNDLNATSKRVIRDLSMGKGSHDSTVQTSPLVRKRGIDQFQQEQTDSGSDSHEYPDSTLQPPTKLACIRNEDVCYAEYCLDAKKDGAILSSRSSIDHGVPCLSTGSDRRSSAETFRANDYPDRLSQSSDTYSSATSTNGIENDAISESKQDHSDKNQSPVPSLEIPAPNQQQTSNGRVDTSAQVEKPTATTHHNEIRQSSNQRSRRRKNRQRK